MSTLANVFENLSGWKKFLPTELVKTSACEILFSGVLKTCRKSESIWYNNNNNNNNNNSKAYWHMYFDRNVSKFSVTFRKQFCSLQRNHSNCGRLTTWANYNWEHKMLFLSFEKLTSRIFHISSHDFYQVKVDWHYTDTWFFVLYLHLCVSAERFINL